MEEKHLETGNGVWRQEIRQGLDPSWATFTAASVSSWRQESEWRFPGHRQPKNRALSMRADTTLQEIAWIYPEDLTLSWCIVLRLLRSRRAKRGRFPTLTACWNKSGMRIWTCWNETRSNQAGSNMKWSKDVPSNQLQDSLASKSRYSQNICIGKPENLHERHWNPSGAIWCHTAHGPPSLSGLDLLENLQGFLVQVFGIHRRVAGFTARLGTAVCCFHHVKRNHPGLCKWKALLSNACQASGS